MATSDLLTLDELHMAARNHALPLEALRYPLTPIGLHYLLIHYDIPSVDDRDWRLTIDGAVERPLSLSIDELRRLPAVEIVATMECAGNGRALLSPRPPSQPWRQEAIGTARWGGVPLRAVLERAGPREAAVEVLFTGLDKGVEGDVPQSYQRSVPIEEALRDEVLLAYEMNGQPLPPQHGFPLRLVVPGWYGMTNVKWLDSVSVLDRPFSGYQHARAYRFRVEDGDEGVPVTRMQPRSLMVPPGIPEFLTRERTVESGLVRLQGRAWSGWGDVAAVDVSVDHGRTWHPAELSKDVDSPWAWRSWSYDWLATAGRHVVCCRASDTAGNIQPLEQVWNVGGYANNTVQRIAVTVV